jgi:hypothetical protein
MQLSASVCHSEPRSGEESQIFKGSLLKKEILRSWSLP